MEAKETESRPAHIPDYWKWGAKTDTWSFLIKFVSKWKWTIPGKQGSVNLNGKEHTFFVPPRWKALKDGQDYLFTTSARTDKDTGEITHLVAIPYPPLPVPEGDPISPVFRLVGKLKFVVNNLGGFRIYRNVKTPDLKKKFMVHILGPFELSNHVDSVCEIYGMVNGTTLLAGMVAMLDVSPPIHEIQEVRSNWKFRNPKPKVESPYVKPKVAYSQPKPKAERVRVKPKW